MRRRDMLLGSGALFLSACAPRPSETPLPASYAPVAESMTSIVNPEALPGNVWLVARGEDVVAQANGVRAVGSQDPMRRDTIFRIASMTKAVTAASVMMLIEDGKLSLDENAERLLPELANRRVLRTLEGPITETAPANGPIRIRQIMNFTFGFGMSLNPALPIMQAGIERRLTLAEPFPLTPYEPDAWMASFAELPLMYQPGDRWLYNVGSLLQGVLVKRASGKEFDAFLEERITGPLGMRDTSFVVPANKLDRMAGCGAFTNPETQEVTRMDREGAESDYARRPAFLSGAAGLCSTADDYLAFARMLKNRGQHNGQQIMSAASAELMTTNQLSQIQRVNSAESLFPGFFETNGWGYGVGVQVSADAVTHLPGTWGWDGGYGTTFFVDPNRDMIAIAMTQSADFLFNGAKENFRRAVYQATA